MKLIVIPSTPMRGGRQTAAWPRRNERIPLYTPNVKISAEREDPGEAVAVISHFLEVAGIDPLKTGLDGVETN